MAYLCVICTTEQDAVEFPRKDQWLKHLQAHKDGLIKPKQKEVNPPAENVERTKEGAVKVEEKQPLRPVVLEYRFSGQCDTCGREVDTTIPIDFKDFVVQVAYCSTCKKELAQQKVIPIDKQDVGR